MRLPKAANCSPEIHVKEIRKKFRKACELERTLTIFEIFQTEFGESGSYTRGTAWSTITYTRAPRCKLPLSPRTAFLRPIAATSSLFAGYPSFVASAVAFANMVLSSSPSSGSLRGSPANRTAAARARLLERLGARRGGTEGTSTAASLSSVGLPPANGARSEDAAGIGASGALRWAQSSG